MNNPREIAPTQPPSSHYTLPIDWWRLIPFIFIHVACLAVFVVGVSWIAVVVCVLAYFIRLFAISVFYHRGFAHRAFKAPRFVWCVFATLGVTATQRGPIWWAGLHRLHHQYADTEKDPHNSTKGFWHSHMLWFLRNDILDISLDRFKDLSEHLEIRWLDRNDLLVSIIFAVFMFFLGVVLEPLFPSTNGWQMLVWGYFVSTVVLMHITFFVNSLGHKFGKRVHETQDGSKNLWWLAFITLGEGWHNNHHKFAWSARLGHRWWQVDAGYYGLLILKWLRLVHDVKLAPEQSIK